MKNFITIICLFLAFFVRAQEHSIQNLYFSPLTHKRPNFKSNDYVIGSGNAFYIYRNCVYRVIVSIGGGWLIRITDIRNDSIYYDHFGAITSYYKDSLFRLHPSQIVNISNYENAVGQMFNTIDLKNYRHCFENCDTPKAMPATTVEIWSRDSSRSQTVELVRFLHGKHVSPVFLKCNKAFYYDANVSLDCEDGIALDRPPPYPANRRDVIWFTPSNAREISGLSLGLQTFGLNRDSLKIAGLNLNADILSVIFTIYMPFIPRDSTWKLENMPDTVAYSEAVDKMHGLSISAGGLIGAGYMRGLAFNGLWCQVTVSEGVSITGIYNRIDEFHGLVFAGLGNKSIKGSGLQIGLVNKCKHLRGVQIGLWNVNSKRKLPLINWNFN